MSEQPAADGGAFSPPGVTFTRVSPSLVTVRLVSLLMWLALPMIAAIVLSIVFGGWVWSATVVMALLLAWLLWLVPRQVRAMGYAEAADDLLVRKGILFKSLTVVPYGRMQFVDVNAGPLDRAFGVAQVRLHTAAAQTDATIPGLPPDEASRLRDRLTARGEARLAGL